MDRTRRDCRTAAVGWSVAVSLFLAVAACSKDSPHPDTFEPSNFGKFSALVDGVSEAMDAVQYSEFERAGRFGGLFVEGAAPPVAEEAKYASPTDFRLAAEPEISGDTAILTVNVLNVAQSEQGEVVGTTKWTAVQVEGGWLLKEVPLP